MEHKLKIVDTPKENPYQAALEEAMSKDEKGNVETDSAGKPIFKDKIEWMTDAAQITAIWTATKAALEAGIVPPNEEDACFDLLELYAKEHINSSKPFKIIVPINYFVGTWHVLNSCRMFDLFNDDKALSSAIDDLTLWFANRIDMYHEVKRKEGLIDKVNPEAVLNHAKLESKSYYPEVANTPVDSIT